jgi:membrane-associated phospholipid phosphatase
MALWTVAPSFGAFSVYDLPKSAANLPLALDQSYANALAALLKNGPGYVSPRDAKGLIGFPSYHAVLALLVIAYTRAIPALRWPALVLNLVVLIATPLQGGHHLVDVLGGFPVAGLSIALAAQFTESTRVRTGAKTAPAPPPLVTGSPVFPAASQA